MRVKAHYARLMRFQVLCLGPECAIWTREEQVVVDQGIEGGDVGVELRGTQSRLERDDLGVVRTNEHRSQRLQISVVIHRLTQCATAANCRSTSARPLPRLPPARRH